METKPPGLPFSALAAYSAGGMVGNALATFVRVYVYRQAAEYLGWDGTFFIGVGIVGPLYCFVATAVLALAAVIRGRHCHLMDHGLYPVAVGLGAAHAIAIHLLIPTSQFESSKPLPWDLPLVAQVVTLLWFPVASAVLLMPKRTPEPVDDVPGRRPTQEE